MSLLEENLGDSFARTISHTVGIDLQDVLLLKIKLCRSSLACDCYQTRRPQEHEDHGKKYYFVTRSEMDAAIVDNTFLEIAEVTTSTGTNMYGRLPSWRTPKAAS